MNRQAAIRVEYEVTQGTHEDGLRTAEIVARFPPQPRLRAARAVMHRLAAEVELATPISEWWRVEIVEPSASDGAPEFRVRVVLCDGTDDEAEEATLVLRRVLGC